MFEVIKKQEETRQAEMAAKAAEFKAIQAQAETVKFTSNTGLLYLLKRSFL